MGCMQRAKFKGIITNTGNVSRLFVGKMSVSLIAYMDARKIPEWEVAFIFCRHGRSALDPFSCLVPNGFMTVIQFGAVQFSGGTVHV